MRVSALMKALLSEWWAVSKDEGSFSRAVLDALAEEYGFSLKTPFKDYPDDINDINYQRY